MAAQSRVALTGWDGDALMCESPRSDFRALFKRFDFGQLAADMGWYMRSKRALPPIGVRTWIKRKLGKYPARSAYPSWVDPLFASRVDLRARWEQINAEARPVHPTRPQTSRLLLVPNWWLLFESYDAGVTHLALEARHPLIDLRLVDYVLAIPPVPWCVEKHILREAMANTLPDTILRRPKSPLAGDPVLKHVRANSTHELKISSSSTRTEQYIVGDPLALLADAKDANAVWRNLQPCCLSRWFAQQRSGMPILEESARDIIDRRESPIEELQRGQ